MPDPNTLLLNIFLLAATVFLIIMAGILLWPLIKPVIANRKTILKQPKTAAPHQAPQTMEPLVREAPQQETGHIEVPRLLTPPSDDDDEGPPGFYKWFKAQIKKAEEERRRRE